MKIQRIFHERVNISAPPISFCADLHNNLLRQLSFVYKNKCYKDCYITEINDIIKRSDCITSGDTAYIDVEFTATAIVYNRGDMITGCEIKQRRKEFLILKTQRENIFVNNDPLTEALQEKLKVPIIVKDVAYRPFSSEINITGSIFMLEKAFPRYKVSNTIQKDLPEELSAMIKEQQDKLKQHDQKIYKVITETVKAWPGTQPVGNVVNLDDLESLKIGEVVGRDTRGDLTQPTAYVADSDDYVELSISDIAQQLYTEYYNWLVFINEMCEVYNTEEQLKLHRAYWTILASRKKVGV